MQNRQQQYNFPLAVLTGFCLRYQNISGRGFFVLLLYYVKLLYALPLDMLQNFFYGKKIKETQISKSPVFIIGHYRSGTTYLHTLLSGDKQFGYLSNYDMICPYSNLLFGAWLKKMLQQVIYLFNIKTSMFNNKIPELDEPAEEDRFTINKGSAYTDYWGFLFPHHKCALKECTVQLDDRQYFNTWKKEYLGLLKLITFKHSGKQLILKSPQNTLRIRHLLKLFPDGKFIYLCRNPYHVFYSMINLWMRSIKKYSLQDFTEAQAEEIVLTHFAEMMEQYEQDKKLIPTENLFELQYERLETDTFESVRKIYEGLGLPHFEIFAATLREQIIKNKQYRKFNYCYDENKMKLIRKRWGKYIERWENNVGSGFKVNIVQKEEVSV